MKKQWQISKIISLSMVAMLILVALAVISPMRVSAAEIAHDSCGPSLSWSLSDDGVLTISGSGDMTSHSWSTNYKSSIKSVILPNGLTSISKDAFSGCSQLNEVVIPDTVTSINGWTFDGCTSLETVVIGDGVTSIGDGAFKGCSSLKEITIGSSVNFIQHSTAYLWPAFAECVALRKVINKSMLPLIGGQKTHGEVAYHATEVEFDWSGTCGDSLTWTLDSTDHVLRISGSGEMTSRPWSDMASVIKGVEFASDCTVTSIYNNAFEGIKQLESISIPNTVSDIGKNAFANCSSLKEIAIPDSVTSMGGWVFEKCTALEKAVIGDGLTSIGDGAFQGCSSLADVTIGKSVKSIQNGNAYCWPAFSGCENLKTVINKSMLPIIKGQENHGEVSLYADTVEFDWNAKCGDDLTWTLNSTDFILRISGTGSMTSAPWGDMRTVIVGVELENGMTTIVNRAFSGFTLIKEINIPDTVTGIGVETFNNCSKLEKAVIGDGVTNIADSAFMNCKKLTEVTVGRSVTTIQNNSSYCYPAFFGCENLATVFNRSKLTFTIGASNYGDIAKYAVNVYNTIEHKTVQVSDTVYNGNEQKQTVTIEGLTEGTDFDVTYSADCTNVGTVNVTVTGKGNYFGTLTSSYNITKADKAAPALPTAENIGKDSITLKAIDGCEYSIDGTTWQDSNVFDCLTIATSYTFYQRFKETANYNASTASSADISTHSHSFSETWSNDETHHWHVCNGCEDKDGYAEHVFDQTTVKDSTTRVKAGTCTDNESYFYTCVCGAIGTETYEEPDSHDENSHTMDTFTYTPNAGTDTHTKKHECCGAVVTDSEAHAFGEWSVTKEATETEAGERQRTCVCGFAEIETIPVKASETSTSESETTTYEDETSTYEGETTTYENDTTTVEFDTTSVDEPKQNGLPPVAVVTIAVGGTAAVGVIVFAVFRFVVKKKKIF